MTKGQRVRVVRFFGSTTSEMVGRRGRIVDARLEGAVVMLDGEREPILLWYDEIEKAAAGGAATASQEI